VGYQIQDFKDLLARIDGLLEASRKAGVDPRMIRQLTATRLRVVRIQAHITGESNPGYPTPGPKPVSVHDGDEMLATFGELVDATKGCGFSTTLTHYLHNARLRLTFCLRGKELRLASRRLPEPGRTARLEWPGGSGEGTLLDTSAFGVGLETDTPVEADTVVQLTIEEPGGKSRTYECMVVHCQPMDSGYHLGLEIFTSKL